MADFLADLFEQFDGEEQAQIKDAEDSATEILARGTAAANLRLLVTGLEGRHYWVHQPENDARADAGGIVFSAYVNALWRKTNAAKSESVDDFFAKTNKLIDPLLKRYGEEGKELIGGLRTECRYTVTHICSQLQTGAANATPSIADSAVVSPEHGTDDASGYTDAVAGKQSETEKTGSGGTNTLPIYPQPPAVLDFSANTVVTGRDSWSRRKRRMADYEARDGRRHLGKDGPQFGRQEELLRDARAWAKAELKRVLPKASELGEINEQIVKRTWDDFVPTHRDKADFKLGYQEFARALWEQGWPSLQDLALEAFQSALGDSPESAGVPEQPDLREDAAPLTAHLQEEIAERAMGEPKSFESISAGIVDDVRALVEMERLKLQPEVANIVSLRTFDLNDPFEVELYSTLEHGARELAEFQASQARRPAQRLAIIKKIYAYIESLWWETGWSCSELSGPIRAAYFGRHPALDRLRIVIDTTLRDCSRKPEPAREEVNMLPQPERTGGTAPRRVGTESAPSSLAGTRNTSAGSSGDWRTAAPLKPDYAEQPMADLPRLPAGASARIELVKLDAAEKLRKELAFLRKGLLEGEDESLYFQTPLCFSYGDYIANVFFTLVDEYTKMFGLQLTSGAVNLIWWSVFLSTYDLWVESGGKPEHKDAFVEAAYKVIKTDERYKEFLGKLASAGLDASGLDPVGNRADYGKLPAGVNPSGAAWSGASENRPIICALTETKLPSQQNEAEQWKNERDQRLKAAQERGRPIAQTNRLAPQIGSNPSVKNERFDSQTSRIPAQPGNQVSNDSAGESSANATASSSNPADTVKKARAETVAKLIKELDLLKPQMLEDESEYRRLREHYPQFLTFRIAENRPDLKLKLLSIRGSTRHIRLAQELAAAQHGKQLSTIQDDWKDHKPPEFKRPQ